MDRLRTALFYFGYVLFWSAMITLGGALVGSVIFPVVGSLAGMDLTVGEMARNGARQIGFLTFIWAVGIAIVMAFQRAHRLSRAQRPSGSSPANDG